MKPPKEIIDLGHELYNGMPNLGANHVAFWPLETFEATRTHSQGKMAMEGRMMLMAEHCGTHIDVPRHFVEGGASVEQVPLEKLILPGHLLDFSHKKVREPITVADFEAAESVPASPSEAARLSSPGQGWTRTGPSQDSPPSDPMCPCPLPSGSSIGRSLSSARI